MTDTITVTVRDRTAEPGWGSGLLRVCTRKVEISISCAHCGGRRGIPKPTYQHEDGITYWVDTWTNPCGHVDHYASVLAEALVLAAARGTALPPTTTH
ncbi:hypothetical protein ACFTZB_32585 [Rhodococcus sp. NPDC057014]|uniref:hypothetical protein n=1 Tax=Rhodococcus sp. NPDC057014 TaxID=3346000 RepID=UPI00363340D0